jgi:tyrosyl-tRNA synthetase
VERFHDRKAAVAARESFIARFQGGAMPEAMAEKTLDGGVAGVGIAAALSRCKLTASNSEAFRMIQQGGVRIDGEKVSDRSLSLPPGSKESCRLGS